LEGNGAATSFTFTVERTGGTTGDVNFSGELTSATADSADLAGTPALPTPFNGAIIAGATTATVTLQVNGDTDIEPNEPFTLTLQTVGNSNATIPTSLGAQTVATGTIVDDDASAIGGIAIFDEAPPLQGAAATPAGTGALNLVRL